MIITFSGRAGAGKDTVADLLLKALPGNVKLTRFAEPLKVAAGRVFDTGFDQPEHKDTEVYVYSDDVYTGVSVCMHELHLNNEHWADIAQKVFAVHDLGKGRMLISPRQYQQLLGTEVVRRIKESAFVDRVDSLRMEHDVVLVPDCRFANELGISQMPVYIHNPNVATVNKHSSEVMAEQLESMYLGEYNFLPSLQYRGRWFEVINNTQDMPFLEREVERLLKHITGFRAAYGI